MHVPLLVFAYTFVMPYQAVGPMPTHPAGLRCLPTAPTWGKRETVGLLIWSLFSEQHLARALEAGRQMCLMGAVGSSCCGGKYEVSIF